MKLKFLLFALLFSATIVQAQDTIRTLIITEVRMDAAQFNYVEITNVGNETINLGDFELGRVDPWTLPYSPTQGKYMRLPELELPAGESYVLASVFEYGPKKYQMGLDGFPERATKKEIWDLADVKIDFKEPGDDGSDIVSPYWELFDAAAGRDCYYIEQHLSETDSVVIDQVGGVFDEPDGTATETGGRDVAGFYKATRYATLIRRYDVKTGNTNFNDSRGISIEDSEWIPVYNQGDVFRSMYWTLGNHGDFNLNESTLKSDIIDVDFANKILTIPWGIRCNDDIMNYFEKTPGIAWNYIFSELPEDSLFRSARTGDKIAFFACGTDLDIDTFNIVVKEPSVGDNIVIPKFNKDPLGEWKNQLENGIIDWPRVTRSGSDMDTITGSYFGIPYATRTDSLLERLEKAPKASWEFVWKDGIERVDLMDGDILKVIAEDGSVKEYYIKVKGYRASHNAYLSSIVWPDVPEYLKGIFGWVGDTIPTFGSTVFNYKLEVPYDVEGIPALVATPVDLNAQIEVKRATSLKGSVGQRTMSFIVTAEDDSTVLQYNIELVKEKNPDNVQPFHAEPFLSEFVFWDQWKNCFAEIANPGNQPLDLSNYMFAMGPANNPAEMVMQFSGVEDWMDRYSKYVPGYKWVSEDEWAVNPGILELDLNVNPIVMPGDVFVMGDIRQTVYATRKAPKDYVWPIWDNVDIDFNNLPWEEAKSGNSTPVRKWLANNNWYMFKILNDSVKNGLKPANDPSDFELIESFGSGEGTWPVIGGKQVAMITNYSRKPEFWQGKADFKASFGTTPEDSEWTWTNQAYWQSQGATWPMDILQIVNDIGKHFMIEPTHYKSQITSIVYKVSEGYSLKESLKGVKTGTTVSAFLADIIKFDENQELSVISSTDGSELGMDSEISLNDVLVVVSADGENTTKYRIDITENGLSSNAVLTSNRFTIHTDDKGSAQSIGNGTITGLEYGTTLQTVITNVSIPEGATMSVINNKGAYIPLKQLNYDKTYVLVTVNSNTFIEVTAEDGVTKILYQLKPEISQNEAFVTSTVYNVEQKYQVVDLVPRGTNVATFMNNVVPSFGATIKLVDKLGHERKDGIIVQDDKLIVTSPNGMFTKTYHLSMLSETFFKSTNYLAYILSNKYIVDQTSYKISNVEGGISINNFYANIIVAEGAVAVVTDEFGNEKTSGGITTNDLVKVTAMDEKTVVFYTFDRLVSSKHQLETEINIYPNPTSDYINVKGVERGNRIRIYNGNGSVIRDIQVDSSVEKIQLNDQAAGIYLLVIDNENQILDRYRVIKK